MQQICLISSFFTLLVIRNNNEWGSINRLPLNVNKTKYTYFHKQKDKENIQICLPGLKTKEYLIIVQSKSSIIKKIPAASLYFLRPFLH